MSDFKAKMHQIRFRLGPQTPLGELTVLPQTPQLDLRGATSKGKEGRGRKGGEGGEERDQQKGKGKGDRDGRESLGGTGEGKGKGQGKGEGGIQGARPPQMFFPRTAFATKLNHCRITHHLQHSDKVLFFLLEPMTCDK